MNYLKFIKSFKKENSSKFAEETSEECLLMFLEHFLKKTKVIDNKDNLCRDSDCYCNKYKQGDLMKNCDGGCMYPG